MEKEKEEALKEQWQEALRQQAEAVRHACEQLTKKLNREHRLDKELTVAKELNKARVCYSNHDTTTKWLCVTIYLMNL